MVCHPHQRADFILAGCGNYPGTVNTDEIAAPGFVSVPSQSPTAYGQTVRPGTNVSRAWDLDEMMWDSHGNLGVDGLLPTDRPHVVKLYGSYHFDFGTTIGISQPHGPGTPISIDNGYLVPGNEYFNIFSLDLCPGGPGTGPYLGLCATTLANVQFIVLQASLPVGSPPFHFVATASSMSWGPYTVGPGTLDAVCLDVTGGVLGSYSPVTRITIQ